MCDSCRSKKRLDSAHLLANEERHSDIQLLTMGVTVYNISATSVRVSWPPSPTCRDTFYSVMYDPNWNSLIMGYKRKSFKHEERIPVSQTGTHLANLLPLTAYFLCVTCQAADPVREQCKVFSTLSESSETHDRGGWEHMAGVWLTCCLLLLVVAGLLVWGCLHSVCPFPGRAADSCPVVTNVSRQNRSASAHLFNPRSSSEDSIKRAAAIQPSLMQAHPPSGNYPEHES